MTTYLTFTDQIDAENATKKIWYNYLMKSANNNEAIVGDGTTHYFLSQLQTMSEQQVIDLKLYGKKQSIIQYSEGSTENYVEYMTAYNDPGLFIFVKPDDSLMADVVGYTEQPSNPDWFPPIEE
jgi:hypothetical protein